MTTKKELLTQPIQHIDIKQHNVVALVDAMQHMAFSSRDLYRAASIYDRMLRDTDCGVILCLAGSLISAGLKKVFVDMIRNNMVDAIVSHRRQHRRSGFLRGPRASGTTSPTTASSPARTTTTLRELQIDRIYDTLIDEDELRVCDETTAEDRRRARPAPLQLARVHPRDGRLSRETRQDPKGGVDSIVCAAYQQDVPIFCPAFSDCSAGFGLVAHQHKPRRQAQGQHRQRQGLLRTDPAQDREPARPACFMIGGGVPKNFAQDIVVAAEILGDDAPMHKYAMQMTVADVRDGALSGSTLKEAS